MSKPYTKEHIDNNQRSTYSWPYTCNQHQWRNDLSNINSISKPRWQAGFCQKAHDRNNAMYSLIRAMKKHEKSYITPYVKLSRVNVYRWHYTFHILFLPFENKYKLLKFQPAYF